jgi:hypothetical protein
MTIPFSTGKTISINQLSGVDITDVANNDFYNIILQMLCGIIEQIDLIL